MIDPVRNGVFPLSEVAHGANYMYRKIPKYSDTQNICCNHSKIWTMWLYQSNGSKRCRRNGKQCRPLGAVWSGSALFAQVYLSETLGSLRYYSIVILFETCLPLLTLPLQKDDKNKITLPPADQNIYEIYKCRKKTKITKAWFLQIFFPECYWRTL